MPTELHDQLADLGAKWLKRQGFGVIATDLTALGCRERADVIGFRSQCSATIESKVSRADFLADMRKPHRQAGGIGVYRFFICPPGLILAEDLPTRWGLLYGAGSYDGSSVTRFAKTLAPLDKATRQPDLFAASNSWSDQSSLALAA